MKIKTINLGKIGILSVNLPLIKIGSDKPKGLILSLQHGGESSSLFVIEELIKRQEMIKGTILILPIANPFGQIFEQRNEIIENKDLNRNFPGNPKGNFTSKLAAKIFSLAKNCDFVIDLHNFSRLSPVLAGYCQSQKKTDLKVKKMLNLFQPEIVWKTEPSNGEDKRFKGALDQVLTEQKIPSIFIEIPQPGLVEDSQIEKVKQGIINIFNGFYHNLKINQVKEYKASYIYSNYSGIFESLKKPLDVIRAGQLIGQITLIPEFEKIDIKSEKSGVIISIKPKEVVKLGSKLCSVGQ